MVSKLSGFFQMTANFPDYFKTVWIFPGDCQFSRLFQNCPDFPRWLPIFRIISKLSGFFQITANFPNYFKTVWIFPGECQFSRLFHFARGKLLPGKFLRSVPSFSSLKMAIISNAFQIEPKKSKKKLQIYTKPPTPFLSFIADSTSFNCFSNWTRRKSKRKF